MPFRDGTGPTGQAPMTGRRLGPCVNNDENNKVDNLNRGFGLGRRGAGRRDGLGRRALAGWQRWWNSNN